MSQKSCESCLMPLDKDKGERQSEKYCSYCFQNGALTYKGNNLKEFQKICFDGMVKGGHHPLVAKFYAFLIRFAPRWKNGGK